MRKSAADSVDGAGSDDDDDDGFDKAVLEMVVGLAMNDRDES